MIGFLSGSVIGKGSNFIVIDVTGVGYKVFVGNPERFKEKAVVHIHHHIAESANDLYGFVDKGELEFFEQLLTVSGIGPKLAMAVIANQPVDALRQSIIDSDPGLLQSISGVGSKLAAKIVVELRPKLTKGGADLAQLTRNDKELVEALTKLGYRRQEVIGVVREVKDGQLNERLRAALQLLGG